ncbi:MAG: Leucine--tRNA ligase [Ignavibacteria bacterium]|nr:Leucine--tRNA ligase [Ignavibacteria bacterium]
MKYDFTHIEKKWQKYWEDNKTFKTPDINEIEPGREKYYALDMFPYPSGDGLHVGHTEGYTATDIIARFKRNKGYVVMHPMGWDAFGLPAEQYAVKTGIHPKIRTEECIAQFRRQLKSVGFSIDWEREINTTDKDYVKWTQWMFLKIYNSFYDEKEDKARPIEDLIIPEGLNENEKYEYVNSKRLAYIAEVPVNWCPDLGTVLSNEEVPEQVEKGYTVVRRNMKQWNLRITKYAERLLNDLNELDWPGNVKELQKNWIGKSEGAVVKFKIKTDKEIYVEVFTTRPDTIYGVSYIILAPEHPLVNEITLDKNRHDVDEYIKATEKKSDLERAELSKVKTGVFTGASAINPVNGEELPILISDYVLLTYGTGAIMGVPGHDERDNEFARKFGLKILPVVVPDEIYNTDNEEEFFGKIRNGEICFSGKGISVNSGIINGLKSDEAISKIISYLESINYGKSSIRYKLRDWIFSRQRFWGEPFPLIHLEDGRIKSITESELPVYLPEVESYKPSGTGESPLANFDFWVNTIDSETGKKAERETNTMPQWAGSCWYYLRYLDPKNKNTFCSLEIEKFWMPVDVYIGGVEHSVLHLIYSRFWYKLLYDLGYVNYKEPFRKLFNQGIVLGEDGVKMSKSRGNVINPDNVIKNFGADSMRLFEMFMGPLEAAKPWSTKGLEGLYRFLNRVWRLIIDENTGKLNSIISEEKPEEQINKLLHKTIKKVTEDIEDGDMKFNTAISYLMIFVNELYKKDKISREIIEKFILLLSPFAPHISEEIWERLGHRGSIQLEKWPEYNNELLIQDFVTIVFQVNGKIRAKKEMEIDKDIKSLEDEALNNENVMKHILGKQVVKIITVKNKMVNVVVK